MYNLWDNGCESYVYKPCVAHGKGMVYMSPIVTPQSNYYQTDCPQNKYLLPPFDEF